jgi:protein SCO1/2
MNKLILLLAVLSSMLLGSCGNEGNHDGKDSSYQCPMECEGDKTYATQTSCPVCKMDLEKVEQSTKVEVGADELNPQSVFNLSSKWTTQNDETIELKDLKGDVVVMVMIYTTCQAACPRLVADMRSLHGKVDDSTVKYVLVSIDPKNDTPEKLKEFAIENQMDSEQWIFLQGTEDDVREFSNVLAVKYKQISPLDFSHSNIISVLDKEGVLYHQQEGLGVDNKTTVSKITELLK